MYDKLVRKYFMWAKVVCAPFPWECQRCQFRKQKFDNVFMSTHIHVLKINGTPEATEIIKSVKAMWHSFSKGRKLNGGFVRILKTTNYTAGRRGKYYPKLSSTKLLCIIATSPENTADFLLEFFGVMDKYTFLLYWAYNTSIIIQKNGTKKETA